MKKNLRLLQAMSRYIDMDMFYCITVYDTHISLQGRMCSSTISYIRNLGLIVSTTESGYIETGFRFASVTVEIILT